MTAVATSYQDDTSLSPSPFIPFTASHQGSAVAGGSHGDLIAILVRCHARLSTLGPPDTKNDPKVLTRLASFCFGSTTPHHGFGFQEPETRSLCECSE
ncbi:predicted protein [Lichtheimia corymbifera JMRC:FSU:9682]|uniref:Uncharacterized protein n=1 Tax=Lichtheimia corymbifera JMRC:FSU:9682 TaxID=1263082 RepID=A0A068RM47_9FUNG|nr:predicted protein [Lichtheimia corymbifera JMRC:FSU:9682]